MCVCTFGCSPLVIDTQAGQARNGLTLQQVLQANGALATVLGQDVSYKPTQITQTMLHFNTILKADQSPTLQKNNSASLHRKFSYMGQGGGLFAIRHMKTKEI